MFEIRFANTIPWAILADAEKHGGNWSVNKPLHVVCDKFTVKWLYVAGGLRFAEKAPNLIISNAEVDKLLALC